jgi:hypothetical protein
VDLVAFDLVDFGQLLAQLLAHAEPDVGSVPLVDFGSLGDFGSLVASARCSTSDLDDFGSGRVRHEPPSELSICGLKSARSSVDCSI